MEHDVVVVGAGFSGATLAERFATVLGKKVLVLEKRDHIGGNCYDYLNEEGVLVARYGAHIFHTVDERVWRYVNGFSGFITYVHKVLSCVQGSLVPVPVNITTVNALFGLSLSTPEQMREWLAANVVVKKEIRNSQDAALARVGPRLYELMFRNYTRKQWDRSPADLDRSVLDRIPVRENFDDRYFTDSWQGMPEKGYTELFRRMLDHPLITVECGTNYFDVRERIGAPRALFFSGKMDEFFRYQEGERLEYRSLRFEFETLPQELFQKAPVVNYPGEEHGFTRIVEFKQMTGQKIPCTTIAREYPTWNGEPYYPVPSLRNQDLYARYQRKAAMLEKDKVYFVGRLANYRYFNMDQAIGNALSLFERVTRATS